MVDNYAKMRRTNAKARKYYEKLGHKVFIKQHTRFDKDIWGLADGCFLTKKGRVVFIQIKSNRFSGEKEIRKFCNDWNCCFEIIMFKDRDDTPYIRSVVPNVTPNYINLKLK